MTDNPLVTVVIPCYNHQGYIRDSILSVVRQTYNNIELIVIDDGSKDESPEVIAELAGRHNFYYECQENQGLSSTLNKAINMAKGRYFVNFGSDDIMMTDRIEKQVEFMEKHPEFGISGGNVIFIDADGCNLEKQHHYPYRELTFDDIFLNLKPGISAPTAMVRKEILDEEGGYDPKIPLEDIYMWLKLTSKGYRVAIMEDVLAYYRKHERNTYKNITYMLNSLESTLSPYADVPGYHRMLNKMYISHFIAASKQDSRLAFSVLKMISPRYYNIKVLGGILRTMTKYLLRKP